MQTVETGRLKTATVVRNINTALSESYQLNVPYPAASLAKLWIAAATLHLIEKGEVDLAEPLRMDWPQFRDGNYGTGRLRWMPQAILMRLAHRLNPEFRDQLIPPQTLLSLLQRSVKDSDNLATLVIADKLGRSPLQRVIFDWGMDNTIIHDPEMNGPSITTASDVASFLLDLKKDQLIQPQYRKLLLSWLPKRTMLNEASQPNSVQYKDGKYCVWGDTYFNRVGYVTTRYGDSSLFVILTKDHPGHRGKTSARQEQRVKEFTEEFARSVI